MVASYGSNSHNKEHRQTQQNAQMPRKKKSIDAAIASAWCDGCERGFSSLSYFSQHLWHASNRSCLAYFNSKKSSCESEPRAPKRRKLIQRREAIIRGEEVPASSTVERDSNATDDSVFDFEDDSEGEVTFPRVNEEALAELARESANLEDAAVNGGPTEENGANEAPVAQNEEEQAENDANAQNGEQCRDNEEDSMNETPVVPQLESFQEYVERAHVQFTGEFSEEMEAGIKLMHKFNQRGGSLELFDDVIKWHMEHSDATEYVTEAKLHRALIERYNLEGYLPKERSVLLPHSKETVNLATHCVKAGTADLLTDPRLDDDSFLFFNDDPTAGPPDDMDTVGDINTGKAYVETYRTLIEPQPTTECGRRRVLLPFILYLDGCVTGQFQNIGIEILKFTLGIFKGHIRNKHWAWRNLGFVKKVVTRKKTAEDNIRNSTHVDANNILADPNHRPKGTPRCSGPTPEFDSTLYENDSEEAEAQPQPQGNNRNRKRSIPQVKAQDFHKMLQVLLSGYQEMQEEGGLEWDFWYREKMHKLLFVPFIIFCKADSVEADKFCGLYGSKTEGVKCVCRVCTCPTSECSNPYLHPAPAKKTPEMISKLVREDTEESKAKLKDMSQHGIWNAMYGLRFGAHNNTGVHGAIPWENLHFLQLNWYKTTRECFFVQTGEQSALSRNMDSLFITMGNLLRRQSDRSLPRTMFKGGVREGLLQAHHMTGVMMVMALAMRTTQGANLLLNQSRGPQKQFFSGPDKVRDWIRCLESLLMFEMWLRKPEYSVALVKRACTKVKEIMSMVRTVGQRSRGMGDNRGVFHGVIHIPEMILNFGAPRHFDTQHNEKDHKLDKKTAKRTQQREDTFDMQVGKKVVQRHAVELAVFEIESGRKKWHYYRRLNNVIQDGSDCSESEECWADLCGTVVTYHLNQRTGLYSPKVHSRSVDKNKYKYDDQVSAILQELAADLEPLIGPLRAYGMLKVNSPGEKAQIYRAEPFNQGSPWHDWGTFHWSDQVGQPKVVIGQMKCFLDLTELPQNNPRNIIPGYFALVEIATINANPEEQRKSELFEPWKKKPSHLEGMADTHNRIHMVSISKLRAPAVVVPDLANGNKRAYLRMVPMWLWEKKFDFWLEDPHRRLWEPRNA